MMAEAVPKLEHLSEAQSVVNAYLGLKMQCNMSLECLWKPVVHDMSCVVNSGLSAEVLVVNLFPAQRPAAQGTTRAHPTLM